MLCLLAPYLLYFSPSRDILGYKPRTKMTTVTKDQIIEVLKSIEDPELFLDIWFLGLVYSIDIQEPEVLAETPAAHTGGAKVAIEMTFTSPMCPAGPMLIDQVREGVKVLNGVAEVDVKITFTPPWEPSDEVKGMLGML